MNSVTPEIWSEALVEMLKMQGTNIYVAWFEYLRDHGVIDAGICEGMSVAARDFRSTLRIHVRGFALRMKDEHPELWIALKTKRRLAGERYELW